METQKEFVGCFVMSCAMDQFTWSWTTHKQEMNCKPIYVSLKGTSGNMTLLVFLVTQKNRRGKKILSMSPLQKEIVKKKCCSHHFCQLFPRYKIEVNLWKKCGLEISASNQMAIIYRTIPAPPNAGFLPRLWSAPILCSPPLPPTPSRFFAIPPPLPLPPGLINVL